MATEKSGAQARTPLRTIAERKNLENQEDVVNAVVLEGYTSGGSKRKAINFWYTYNPKGQAKAKKKEQNMRTSGRIIVAAAVILVATFVAAMTAMSCGNYKGGDYSSEDWKHDFVGTLGDFLQGETDRFGKPTTPTTEVPPVQYFEREDAPGTISDNVLALGGTATTRIFGVKESSFEPKVDGTVVLKIPAVNNGQPTNAAATTGAKAGWWTVTMDAATIPAHTSVEDARWVKLDANGNEIAEARITSETTEFGGNSFSVVFDENGYPYAPASESAPGKPGNAGDYVVAYLVEGSGADARYSIAFRTKGTAVRVNGLWNNFQDHDLLTTDVNGWTTLLPLTNIAGGRTLTNGSYYAFVNLRNTDPSADTPVKGRFSLAGTRYKGTLKIGSIEVEVLRFTVKDGVIFPGTSAPALTATEVYPRSTTAEVKDPIAVKFVAGVFDNGVRASLLGSSDLVNPTTPDTAVVSKQNALSFTAAGIGTTDISVVSGSLLATAKNTLKVTVRGTFKDWTPSIDKTEINSGETAQITVKETFTNDTDKTIPPSSIESVHPNIGTATVAGVALGRDEGTATFRITHRKETKSVTVTVKSYTKEIVATASPNPIQVTKSGKTNVTRVNVGRKNNDISTLGTTEYKSKDPGIISVESDGKYTGHTAGATTITITDSVSGKSFDLKLEAKPTVATMSVESATDKIGTGRTLQMELPTTYTGAPQEDAAPKATWRSKNKDVATVNETTGLVTGVKAGTVEIEAEYLGVIRKKTITVVFLPKTLSATLTPGTAAEGSTVTWAVEGTLADDTKSDLSVDTRLTVSADDPTKVDLSINGKATALKSGTVVLTFTFTNDGLTVSTTATLTITAGVATLSATPASVTLEIGGQTQQLTVTATLTDGQPSPVTALATYASSNDDVAKPNAAGLLTSGNTVGTATITVSYGTKTTTVSVTTTSTITVSLDATTPSASSVSVGRANVHMTRIAFSGIGSIRAITVTRTGTSSNTDVATVQIFDGLTPVSAEKSLDANGRASCTLTTPIALSGIKVLTLVADVQSALATMNPIGKTIQLGIASASDIDVGTSTVTGTFPITGNAFTIIGGSLTAQVGGQNPTVDITASVNNTAPVTLLDIQLTTDVVEDVVVTQVTALKSGTHANADITALELVRKGTGVVYATTAGWDANGAAVFTLSPPFLMAAGLSENLLVRVPTAGIVGGTGTTISARIDPTFTGIVAHGDKYNLTIVPTGTWNGTATPQTIVAPPAPPPPVTTTSITASPTSAALVLGWAMTQQLTVTATKSDGATPDATSASAYASDVQTVATVNASGLITAVGVGSATITITYDGKTTTVAVTVTAPVGILGDLIANGTIRFAFGPGTNDVTIFFNKAKMVSDTSNPFFTIYRPNNGYKYDKFGLANTVTGPDGSIWYTATVTLVGNEKLILNYGGNHPTWWSIIRFSDFFDSNASGEGLVAVIDLTAKTIVKGVME